jgi:hypothetical protein
MTSMTAAYFGIKQVGSNQLNSTIFREDTGTLACVTGAQGGTPKISAKISMSEKQNRSCINAAVHMVHTVWLR